MEDVGLATGEVKKRSIDLAIRALDALHLDMGAVSVVESGKLSVVTNVVTYPGLTDELVTTYTNSVREFTGGEGGERQVPKAPDSDAARPELVAALRRKVERLPPDKMRALLDSL